MWMLPLYLHVNKKSDDDDDDDYFSDFPLKSVLRGGVVCSPAKYIAGI